MRYTIPDLQTLSRRAARRPIECNNAFLSTIAMTRRRLDLFSLSPRTQTQLLRLRALDLSRPEKYSNRALSRASAPAMPYGFLSLSPSCKRAKWREKPTSSHTHTHITYTYVRPGIQVTESRLSLFSPFSSVCSSGSLFLRRARAQPV